MFLDTQKLKEFITSRPTPQEMLKETHKQKENDIEWNYGSIQRTKH